MAGEGGGRIHGLSLGGFVWCRPYEKYPEDWVGLILLEAAVCVCVCVCAFQQDAFMFVVFSFSRPDLHDGGQVGAR